jgi:hypothetical protein
MPTEKIEKKDYNRSLTHRELELILEIIKPLSLRLTPENQRILGRATTKLQKLFDEQNPRNTTGTEKSKTNKLPSAWDWLYSPKQINSAGATAPAFFLHGDKISTGHGAWGTEYGIEARVTEHGSLKSFCIYTLPEIYFIKKVKSMV